METFDKLHVQKVGRQMNQQWTSEDPPRKNFQNLLQFWGPGFRHGLREELDKTYLISKHFLSHRKVRNASATCFYKNFHLDSLCELQRFFLFSNNLHNLQKLSKKSSLNNRRRQKTFHSQN